MTYAIAIIALLFLIYGPQLWVQWVLNRYNRQDEENFPGTGGELARHLLTIDVAHRSPPPARTTRAVRASRIVLGAAAPPSAPFSTTSTRAPS